MDPEVGGFAEVEHTWPSSSNVSPCAWGHALVHLSVTISSTSYEGGSITYPELYVVDEPVDPGRVLDHVSMLRPPPGETNFPFNSPSVETTTSPPLV